MKKDRNVFGSLDVVNTLADVTVAMGILLVLKSTVCIQNECLYVVDGENLEVRKIRVSKTHFYRHDNF